MASRMACLARSAIGVALSLVASSAGAEVVVSNVRAAQLADGTKRVEVLYDIAGAPAGGATVSVAFSATGNAPYSIAPAAAALSGDIGAGVASGSNKRIVWDCKQTLAAESYGTTYRAAVTAVDPGGGGQEITVYLGAGSTVPLVLVRIHGGTPFMMGSATGERNSNSYELPQHQVTIAQDYYLGKYEVTQAQWQAVMGSNPASSYGVGADYPVYYVSWNDIAGAGGFIDKVNQAQSTTKFRLPTEAEWEYAARAGTATRFSYGDVLECGDSCESCATHAQYMWWCGNAGSTSHPRGEKLANPWGLFDMHGNVWEWVQDWWHDTYTGAPTDGSAWVVPSSSYRVFRGGGWYGVAFSCRSAYRFNSIPDVRNYNIGFRLARSQ